MHERQHLVYRPKRQVTLFRPVINLRSAPIRSHRSTYRSQGELIKNPLRFNTFLRLFFDEITLDTENKGMGWRKGWGKTDLRFAKIVSFRFNPLFDSYFLAQGCSLPPALQTSMYLRENQISRSATDRRACDSHTSPRSPAHPRLEIRNPAATWRFSRSIVWAARDASARRAAAQ